MQRSIEMKWEVITKIWARNDEWEQNGNSEVVQNGQIMDILHF